MASVFVPDGDVDLNQWRTKHADHFASNQHVSESKFAEYFGSRDLGCRLWIPAGGSARDEWNARASKNASRRPTQKEQN